MRKILRIDIETFSEVDLPDVGVYAYSSHPSFEILWMSYAYDDEPVQLIDLTSTLLPTSIRRDLKDPNITKCAFNASFERVCLGNYFFGAPLPPDQWTCTMIQSWYNGLNGGLDAVSKALKLEELKDSSGKSLITYFCKPCKATKKNKGRTRNLPEHDTEKWEAFGEYCRQDTEVERAIHTRLKDYPLPEKEQRLWALDQRINDTGILMDKELYESAIAVDTYKTTLLLARMKILTDLENPNSLTQLKTWLNQNGLSGVTSLTKDDLPKLLNRAKGPAKEALEIRQELGKTSVAKYEKMSEMACDDGRFRGAFQFYGASRTGRWAGRGIQLQNLPRPGCDADELGYLRERLRAGADLTSEQLSWLVRTVFIPAPGNVFVVSDFSAIEARVVAWLAGEESVLEVFRDHGLIYESTAAKMFEVSIESIYSAKVKAELYGGAEEDYENGENYHLRQQGKVASLACGYQGGKGAIARMDFNKSIPADKHQELVDSWRNAHPNIVKFWYDCERAAVKAIQKGEEVYVNDKVSFSYQKRVLRCHLPSGRSLAYIRPKLEVDEKFGKLGISFESAFGTRERTYGGKLVENCISGEATILTDSGFKLLQNLSLDDLIFNGCEFVVHSGLVDKGYQRTINVDGVYMTPDHKILTKRGWLDALESRRSNRIYVGQFHGIKMLREQKRKAEMAGSMSMWGDPRNGYKRHKAREMEILRMQKIRDDCECAQKPRQYEFTSTIPRLAICETTMHTIHRTSMEKLWGSRNNILRPLVELLELCGRYVAYIRARFNFRQNRCKRSVLQRKLSLDNVEKTSQKQENQQVDKHSMGADNSIGSIRTFRDWCNNIIVQIKSRCFKRKPIHKTELYKQVFDVMNCGDENRFAVLSDSGFMIVHNCTQAVARDCLAEKMMELDTAGYMIVGTVHDEAILEIPEGWSTTHESIIDGIMCNPIEWAPDLPLAADTGIKEYYSK